MTSLLSHLVSLAFFISFILLFSSASSNEERKIYIVYMGAQHSSRYPTYELHLNLLKEILVNCSPSESLVYSYQRSFSGFAAKLSIDEAEKLNGHGAHTASTAAGRTVCHANLYGLAKGMARGAVPSARLAVYKVCWLFGCTDQDILAAFDDAISDGVDIISLSVGGDITADYFQDPIAIGAFHAMANEILMSTAAGNAGPYRGTVSNVAPWTLVAAASSIDRHIIDKVVTGNHVSTLGASVNTFATKNMDDHPLIYMQGNATILPGDCTALPDINIVKGKIVLCKYFSDEIFSTGIKGLIFIDDSSLDVSDLYPVPFITVSSLDGLNLLSYINNTKNPVANIHKSEEVFDSEAPLVASFSSRGPNTITPDILKPELTFWPPGHGLHQCQASSTTQGS
ncbi:hypothetical protein ZIOFF_057442 [Zingiber officinale]|uniref:Peptidase S8/S53 domain-containing protein n=1 Tax=Zingiber officinale TaxID=94328 RepID=A0A8J5F702_ZINOF|nr:hypothetical protein ZIOFF_057442 [Zingiber officinale]